MNQRQVPSFMPGARRRAGGFTLIEVLVTIVVLSFGLLGLAGMQLTSLKNSRSSVLRSLAMQHAYDMADRMRSNLAAVGAGSYDMSTPGAGTNTAACLTTAGCTPAQMAGQDIYEWQQALSSSTNAAGNGLPSGQGIVCIDSSADATLATPAAPLCDNLGHLFRIKVWYQDDTSDPNLKVIVVDFQA